MSAYVLLAITEDKLSTSVRGGENGGRTLHHDAVVRQLQVPGKAKGDRFEKSVHLAPAHDWNSANLNAAVFVQESDGKILGAAPRSRTTTN